jgi:hypothetical protein
MSESKNRCYKTDQGPNMTVLLLAVPSVLTAHQIFPTLFDFKCHHPLCTGLRFAVRDAACSCAGCTMAVAEQRKVVYMPKQVVFDDLSMFALVLVLVGPKCSSRTGL